MDLFSPLGCGIQTGAGAIINSLDVQPGKSVAIFGVGSVGVSAVMAANMRNAKTIIAIDLQPQRLELARKLGATHTVVGSDSDVVAQIQKISGSNGVDYSVDCSGIPQVVEKALDCLGTRGKGATVGAPTPGKRAGVDVFAHLVMGRQYIGCCEGDSDPQEVRSCIQCQLEADGIVPAVSHRAACEGSVSAGGIGHVLSGQGL